MGIQVKSFYEEARVNLPLEVVYGEEWLDRPIHEDAINRPGLALAGFFKYFAFRRVQVLGLAEINYLNSLSQSERRAKMEAVLKQNVPCLVFTRNRTPFAELESLSADCKIPILRTSLITSRFINLATIILETLNAPKERVQGTMLDIQGIGVLIEGEPGIGKSESALALIARGHSLISDDITVFKRDYTGAIMGTAVEMTKYHMEIRGLGIVHVPSLFGVASMRQAKRLDLVIRLQKPDPEVELDRTGLKQQFKVLLGEKIPLIVLPVAPGRDMVHVIETAALNQKMKQLGHDAAKELDDKLMRVLSKKGLE